MKPSLYPGLWIGLFQLCELVCSTLWIWLVFGSTLWTACSTLWIWLVFGWGDYVWFASWSWYTTWLLLIMWHSMGSVSVSTRIIQYFNTFLLAASISFIHDWLGGVECWFSGLYWQGILGVLVKHNLIYVVQGLVWIRVRHDIKYYNDSDVILHLWLSPWLVYHCLIITSFTYL